MKIENLKITDCARCDGDHYVRFVPITEPVAGYTHVGVCRVADAPVLMRFVEKAKA